MSAVSGLKQDCRGQKQKGSGKFKEHGWEDWERAGIKEGSAAGLSGRSQAGFLITPPGMQGP